MNNTGFGWIYLWQSPELCELSYERKSEIMLNLLANSFHILIDKYREGVQFRYFALSAYKFQHLIVEYR